MNDDHLMFPNGIFEILGLSSTMEPKHRAKHNYGYHKWGHATLEI